MPLDILDLDVSVDTGAIPQPTFNDVLTIGVSETEPPNAAFGESNRYQDSSQVAEDYGEGSDVHVASEAIQEMGAENWRVMVAQEQTVSAETVNDGETLANTPVYGDTPVSSAGDETIEFTTGLPSDENPEAGVVLINPATGEVAIGDSTSVDLDYSYVEWPFAQIPNDVDVIGFADTGITRQHYGDLSELDTYATGAGQAVVAAYEDGREYADEDEALAMMQDVGSAVPSNSLLTIAHKSSADVGSYVLGLEAVQQPWLSKMWDDAPQIPVNTDYYSGAIIGDPATPGTLEGGISASAASNDQEEGMGATNVLISVAGVQVVSNWQTTAGPGSPYQYFDIYRTEQFARSEIQRAIRTLKLNNDQIPFAPVGRTIIESGLSEVFDNVTGGVEDPFASVDVRVPQWDELTEEQRANRRWEGIDIDARLTGDVHQFGITLNLEV